MFQSSQGKITNTIIAGKMNQSRYFIQVMVNTSQTSVKSRYSCSKKETSFQSPLQNIDYEGPSPVAKQIMRSNE